MRIWFLLGALWMTASHAGEPSKSYDTHCALCHQKAGAGLAGQFPRLAGRASQIARTEDGRRFLIEVTLFGMAGKVEIDGVPIIGVMPPFAALSDDEIASALNYIIGLEARPQPRDRRNHAPGAIVAADIKRVREGSSLSPAEVRARRELVVKAR